MARRAGHLSAESANLMMSVTNDCKTLPSALPHSQLWSLRAEGKEGGMVVGEIITSINDALRTIRTAGHPDLVSKATSAHSFVL